LEFTIEKGYPTDNEITILDENGLYTDGFKALTAPFYPAF